jgi:hypothetical protein
VVVSSNMHRFRYSLEEKPDKKIEMYNLGYPIGGKLAEEVIQKGLISFKTV